MRLYAATAWAHYPNAIDVDPTDDETIRELGLSPWHGNASYTHTFNIGETGLREVTGDLFHEGKGIDQIMGINEPVEYAMAGLDAFWLGDISVRYSSGYGMPFGMSWHVRAWNSIWDSDDLYERDYADDIRNQNIFASHSGYMVGRYTQSRISGIAFGANW